jgi:chromosome segregation ATPase
VRQYLELTCPSCQHGLQVRTEYLGKRVRCKYCHQAFRVRAPAAPPAPAAQAEARGQQTAQLEEELQGVRADLVARAAEHAAAVQGHREARDEVARLQGRMQELEAEAEEARDEHGRETAALRQQYAEARAQLDQLRARVVELLSRADEVEPLEAGLEASGEEIARLEEELAASRAEAARAAEQLTAAESLTAELDALHGERARLTGELEAARTAWDELTGKLDEAAQEAEQLHARVLELERAHVESAAAHGASVETHQEAVGRWEAERAELHRQWEERHAAQAKEAEEQLRREQALAEAERQQHEQQLEEVRRDSAHGRGSLLTELEGLREIVTSLAVESEAARQQIDALTQERDQLAAHRQELEQRFQQELGQLTAALEQSRQQGGVPARAGDGPEAQPLREELARAETERRQHAQERARLQSELEQLRGFVSGLSRDRDQLAAMREEELGLWKQALEQSRQQEEVLARARNELAQQVQTLQAEVEQLRQAPPAAPQPAPDPATIDPWAALVEHAEAARAVTDAMAWQQLHDARREFAKQRTALEGELARIRQENAQMRRLLGTQGIQMMPVQVRSESP